MMKVRLLSVAGFIVSLALLLALVPARTELTKAQEPQPPIGGPQELYRPPRGFRNPWQKPPGGQWFTPEGGQLLREPAGITAQGTGGPDDFGYTWDDSVAFNWIDATTGTNTGLEGDDQYTDAIDIGFGFRFYENTYSQLYVNTNGLVTFGEGAYSYSNRSIPSPVLPNNFIAPLWDDLCVNYGNYNTGTVFYLLGGSTPNRYFVIEWHEISRLYATDLLTFEVILYENGDIMMQYQNLSGYLESATVGIEDDIGVDGLQYLYNAQGLENDKAVRFYRPGPQARLKVWPPYHSRFTHAGGTVSFQVPVRNIGELGADTYDLFISSSWATDVYAADGITPLTDTDSDGAVDTGPAAQGQTVTVTVKVQTPAVVNVADANAVTLTVRSSLDTGKSKAATLQTAVPASFAQVFRDDADGAMSLYLAQPTGQAVTKATSDWYYGAYMAVAEMPNSFAYFWSQYRWTGSLGTNEIEYTLLDRSGQTVRGVSKLTDHSGATMDTFDSYPAAAVAPNGRIGVVWQRYLWNDDTSQFNYNIYFAILDASGNLVYGPANLTNNDAWSTGGDYGVPEFYAPRIAATSDNRFTLAWQRYSSESEGSLYDIYYATRDINGGEVKAVTKFTTGASGGNSYQAPALAALSGNRALLAYTGPSGISYAVLDSGGNTVKAETAIGGYGWGPDAVQLSSGNVVVTWSGSIEFAVLDSATYDVIAGPTALSNPAAITGDNYVSVAADVEDHAILTWMDYDWRYRRNLYYALVDGGGNVLTDPMIFYTSQATDPYVETSYEGHGNTSYSVTPIRQVFLPLVLKGYSPQ